MEDFILKCPRCLVVGTPSYQAGQRSTRPRIRTRPELTLVDIRQIHDIRSLRYEFIDRVLYTQSLVELARDACKRTIGSFVC